MPTITVNRKIFEKLVGKKLPLETLKDRISYLGTALESINENEIIVEVAPNRPDMLSAQGLARAFSSFVGLKAGLRKYDIKKSNYKVVIEKSVENIRPYTACAIIKNLKFDDEKIKEVIQIQEKLHVSYGRNRKRVAIGIYPLEKIKMPIRYVAKEPSAIKFQPLDSNRIMTASQILAQTQPGKDYAHLLEGLSKYPIFIDANNNILSMPPIINSELTGKVTGSTGAVFVECSGFDFETLSKCLNIIVTALADMGCQIFSMELCYPNKRIVTPDLNPKKMDIDINYVNRMLGLKMKENEIKRCLERMGYSYLNKKVFVPAYRTDVLHQIDLAEDMAIAYGYENFKEEIPCIATIGKENEFEVFKNKVAEVLIGFGLIEASTYHLINKEVQTVLCNLKADVIELENASSENNSLRLWTIPSLLNVLKENKHNEYPQKIFEAGFVFKKNEKQETNTEEETRLALLSCHAKADYTEAKQYFDALFNSLGLKYQAKETEHPSFIEGRVARVSIGNADLAYIGELHPKILTNFELEFPVACFELNLTELFKIKMKR